MAKISVLGCGWLGLPLAKALLVEGFDVKGSTTSDEKISLLANFGIKPFLISISENRVVGAVAEFLQSEILIVDIPPKLRGSQSENFVSKIKNLIVEIENSPINKVLFISSTSVYADDNSIITEEKIPNPDNDSGRQLFESEAILQQNENFETTILRFSGLIGENRHPIKFLAGKENVENPEAPVNLIHQTDCIGIILKIIKNQKWNQVFNAAAPFHPPRKEYYTTQAKLLNLEEPKFSNAISVGKTIDSSKIIRELDYEFIFEKL